MKENELVDLVVGREVICHEEKEETTEGAKRTLLSAFLDNTLRFNLELTSLGCF